MKIRFLSSNQHKIAEVQRILGPVGVDIIAVPQKIQELQTEDVHALVKDKLIKDFGSIGRPLFVEHTGLYLSGLNGLPAGLTQIFWDQLKADRFASLVAGLRDDKATLQELADEYGVSAERIRQVEANAMKKMRGVFELEA